MYRSVYSQLGQDEEAWQLRHEARALGAGPFKGPSLEREDAMSKFEDITNKASRRPWDGSFQRSHGTCYCLSGISGTKFLKLGATQLPLVLAFWANFPAVRSRGCQPHVLQTGQANQSLGFVVWDKLQPFHLMRSAKRFHKVI